MSRLHALLPAAGRGSGHLVLVAGEAGIGKTALLHEFTQQHAARGRVLWGTCDPIDPPRPFAPIADVAARVGGPLLAALAAGDRARVFDAFLEVLRHRAPGHSILVLDDLHWADDATLDLLRVVGRRLADIPVLVIGAYREHDVDASHALRGALGDVPPNILTEIRLEPLSSSAVRTLALGTGLDADALHDATAGNPFYVTEVLASDSIDVPSTVRDAVLARVLRLSVSARRLLGAAAVLGHRCDIDLLRRVEPHSPAALAECISRGILIKDGTMVGFRHGIAQQAVLGALPVADRVRLHRRALSALEVGGNVEAAALVHHAVEAGDETAVQGLAPLAGARAEALGANREAAAHYADALRVGSRLDERSRAQMLEAHARAAALSDQVVAALESQRGALEIWRRTGDRLREGDGLRALAGLLWQGGDGENATAAAEAAVAILETIDPPGHELALAVASVAQRRVVTGNDDPLAMIWARRALDLAQALGDEPVMVHALTTLGSLQIYMGDEAGWVALSASLDRARAAGLPEHEGRALVNLFETARDMGRYEVADRYAVEALEYLGTHDFDFFRRVVQERLAELAFERGRWNEAVDGAESILRLAVAIPVRVRALTLLGRIRARRGDPDAWGPLDEALATANAAENQELGPLIEARVETAWLEGSVERARTEAKVGIGLPVFGHGAPWPWAGMAFWAWKAGALGEFPEQLEATHFAHSQGRHREAAAVWHGIGRPYQQALALADSSDEADLREALEIFLQLGATPMARILTGTLRDLGATQIPRGPRRDTQRHPAGLTNRESEVLSLVGEGLTNAEIAARLVLSTKTVDHHVSAVLRKLGAKNRAAAAGMAALQDGQSADPR